MISSPALRCCCKPDGTVTIEFPHLLELIEHVEFDTIYHEHFSYFSLHAIEQVFARQACASTMSNGCRPMADRCGFSRPTAARADLAGQRGVEQVRAQEKRGGPRGSGHVPDVFRTRRGAAGDRLLDFLAERRARARGRGVWRRCKGQHAAQFLRRDARGHRIRRGPKSAQAVEVLAGDATFRWCRREELMRAKPGLRVDPAVESAAMRSGSSSRASAPGAGDSSRRCPWCEDRMIHDIQRVAIVGRLSRRSGPARG